MGKIIILDENTSNKIAAGEVIEKPASVIKELVENSIDAGAGSISIEIKNGGISFIKVTDNGSGIDEDDVEIAFERHATSKIRNSNDLETISTLGFRGEALASIAAVATVELTSRVQNKNYGMYIKIQGGIVKEVRQTGCPVGTTFIIRDLFYNTPARFKFLKKDATEAGYISDIISRVALGNPQISFRLISNNATAIHTPGNNDLLSTIFSLYGKEIASNVYEIKYNDNKFKISGYAGKPEISRANRNHQSLYVNGRYIRSKLITSAIDEAYKTFLLKNKYPFIVTNMEVNPMLVDVNVHPTKMEIRFSDEQEVFRSVYHAVHNALLSKTDVRNVTLNQEKQDFKLHESMYQKHNCVQQDIVQRNSYVQDMTPETYTCKKPNTEPLPKISAVQVNIPEDKISDQPEVSGVIQEAETEKAEKQFSNLKIVGQAFSTYIFLQDSDNVLIIDQHAAHERITYETLRKKYLNNEALSQYLLSPVVFDMTNQELNLLEGSKDFFDKLGFIYESFGNNSIILRSVPFSADNSTVKEVFLDVVDYVTSMEKADITESYDDILYNVACKAAIKANKWLGDMEIRNILSELDCLENPYTCPHGRPTVVKVTRLELEKMFKRIL